MPAIILQFLPYLIQAAGSVPQIWEYIQKLREHAAQSDEWTPALEAQFDQTLRDLAKDPPDWLKTDKERGK